MKNIIEIACNHAGLINRFDSYLSIAKTLDGVAVKFQIFDPLSLCHPTYPFYSDLQAVYISHDGWIPIIETFMSNGIDVWLEPFDDSSFEFVSKSFPNNPIKIPSCDIFHLSSLDISSFPCVGLAIGGLSLDEIDFAITSLHDRSNLVLFYGFQAFPTPLCDINIPKLKYCLGRYNIPVYYADHTSSPDPHDVSKLYSYANALGCSGFERHICLSRDDKYDLVSASLPDELKIIFDTFRSTYSDPLFDSYINSLQSQSDPNIFTLSELIYRNTMQKKVISKSNIASNTLLTPDLVSFKRASSTNGILALDYINLYNKKRAFVSQPIEANQLICSSMFACF